MVVVSAERHERALQLRIAPVENADDIAGVLRPHDLVVGFEIERDFHVREGEARKLLARFRFCLQLRVCRRRLAEEEVKEFVLRGHAGREHAIEPLDGNEVGALDARWQRRLAANLRRRLAGRRLGLG